MGRKKSFSPHAKVYEVARDPQALERERVTRSQVRFDEDTIIWGDDDSLPLRIMKAVDDSPTATACLSEVAKFIKGSKFTSDELMNLQINEQGETLWDLHAQLSDYEALIDGFAVKFSFSNQGKILQAHTTGIESCRLKKNPDDKSKKITTIKYNPYYGVDSLFTRDMTREYPVFDMEAVKDQINLLGNNFPGQIYFYGSERPLYKFYPVPKYWSGKHWIYVDSQIQTFHKQNLDSGFFQSVLMNMIGDPSAESNNPDNQKEVTGTDNVKRKKSTKTVGQEFDERMSSMFSGVGKAGRAMVLWSNNADEAVKVSAFPVNAQFDLLSGTFTDAIRGITIATEVPAILANLPQQVSSLGSDGASMKAAVELMQSRVVARQRILENFYNNVLLPNLETPVKEKVKIVNYSPISTPVEIDDKYWEFMSDEEKAAFINSNVPNVKITRTFVPVVTPPPTQTNENGEVIPPEQQMPTEQVNDALKNLNIADINKVQKIVARYNLSLKEPGNSKALTYDQAKQIILSYGFTEEQTAAWLVKPDEL